MQTNSLPVFVLLAQANTPPEQGESGGLNFEGAANIQLKPHSEIPAANSRNIELTSGLSVFVSLLAVFVSWKISNILSRKSKQFPAQKFSPAWHGLSFAIANFLGLNVFFGGLTAFLLNGNSEDAQVYFSEISALKLTRMSHEHFFGYGILFGTIAALGIIFVGPRKRILFPATVAFLFSALDASSWWLSHYISFGFHTLSYVTGAFFAAGYLAIYIQVAQTNLRVIFGKNHVSE